ncbi:MAG: hypothetical protein AAGC88_14630, partial [Bacteroidota bacterium]
GSIAILVLEVELHRIDCPLAIIAGELKIIRSTHYLEDESGNLWTVVGSYDFELTSNDGQWTIDAMKFNFKYQDGNTSLP